MAIDQNADSIHFAAYPAERTAANALDEAFDITHARRVNGLSVWIAKAHPSVATRFGLEREVVVVFSSYPETDARVLTTFDTIRDSAEFRNRVERTFGVLVHRGDRDLTESLVRTVSDEKVIVSLPEAALTASTRGAMFVRNAIARALAEVDVFGMTSPIRSDAYFFGRDPLVDLLVNRARVQHENSGVFGLRKTGKTSILLAMQRRLDPQRILAALVDCQNPSVQTARWWFLLEQITRRLNTEALRRFHRSTPLTTRYTNTNAGNQFMTDLEQILDCGPFEGLVVQLDEIEWITPGLEQALGRHWREDYAPFWQAIRAAHQMLDGRITFVVSGVNPLCLEEAQFSGIPNPIFQGALPYFLEPLSLDNVRALVRRLGRYAGFDFEEETYDSLRRRFGGHPFLIRLACRELWVTRPDPHPDHLTSVRWEDFEPIEGAIVDAVDAPIREILTALLWWYPDEYNFLEVLASGDRDFIDEWLATYPHERQRVEQYGIVDPLSHQFVIDDLRTFLRQQGDRFRAAVQPLRSGGIKIEMPPLPDIESLRRVWEWRTTIETSLRRLIVAVLSTAAGHDETKLRALLADGLRPRRDRGMDLFEGQAIGIAMSELYLLDLQDIVSEHWESFKGIFDNNKARFDMCMEALNKGHQTEGHSKPITEDEMQEIEQAYVWMRNRLSRFDI